MQSYRSAITGAAMALALAMSPGAARSDGTELSAPAFSHEDASQTFFQPQLGGRNLDIRMMAHMRADPAQTAERFCRDMGFTAVADVAIRASVLTRTITDGAAHSDRGESKQAFAMIRCSTRSAEFSTTS